MFMYGYDYAILVTLALVSVRRFLIELTDLPPGVYKLCLYSSIYFAN